MYENTGPGSVLYTVNKDYHAEARVVSKEGVHWVFPKEQGFNKVQLVVKNRLSDLEFMRREGIHEEWETALGGYRGGEVIPLS